MLQTRFTDLIGCTVPIQLAGMPGVATPELAAAVSEGGGLGMVSGVRMPPQVLSDYLDSVRRLTAKPFGVNFLMPFLSRECVPVAASKARVVEFFYANPEAELVEAVHREGALASWQVGSKEEAIAAEAAGCDFIIAQGIEGGGHIRGQLGLLPLLSEVLDAVRIPVLASGGIGTRRNVAAVLAAGADGARVGTRFIASRESAAHPGYIDALLKARAEDTVITETFSATWPDAPHRVLRSCIDAVNSANDEVVAEIAVGGTTLQVPRFGSPVPTRSTTGNIHAMAMYAGQSVTAVRQIESAREIIHQLMPHS